MKKKLMGAIEKWRELPIKWVREPNLHVTLFFLGYIDDETTGKVCEAAAEIGKRHEIFDINFNEIVLAPRENPRMVWLIGEPSEPLLKLYEDIEKKLGIFKAPKKSFRPHVTLGRLRKNKWQTLKSPPEIKENFTLSIPLESVEIMASHFGKSGNEYVLIESCPLK